MQPCADAETAGRWSGRSQVIMKTIMEIPSLTRILLGCGHRGRVSAETGRGGRCWWRRARGGLPSACQLLILEQSWNKADWQLN